MEDKESKELFSHLHLVDRPILIKNLIKMKSCSRVEAEEAASQAMEELIRKIRREGFQSNNNYSGLFYDIAKKRLFDMFRVQKRICSLDEGKVETLDFTLPIYPNSLPDKELVVQLMQLYKSFDKRAGEMLFYRDFLRFSNMEVALKFGLKENSVGPTLTGHGKKFRAWILDSTYRQQRYKFLLKNLKGTESWHWEWRFFF